VKPLAGRINKVFKYINKINMYNKTVYLKLAFVKTELNDATRIIPFHTMIQYFKFKCLLLESIISHHTHMTFTIRFLGRKFFFFLNWDILQILIYFEFENSHFSYLLDILENKLFLSYMYYSQCFGKMKFHVSKSQCDPPKKPIR
jgi:hypothetical protein